jgi:ABC-type branched-subunit amino acid transport system ATPase component
VLLGVILFFPRGFSRLFPSSRRGTVPEPLAPERGVPIELDVEDITVTFGGVRALEGVRLHVAPGEVLGLVGPNGAGKTTLINVITGTCRPDGGSVRLDGVEITGQPVHRTARRGVARTFQNLRIFGDLTCRENVIAGGITKMPSAGVGQVAGLPVARRIGREQAARAAGLLDQVGLMERDLEKAESLAYGEQRRLEMARAVASRPGLLILDEPAAGMNETEAREIAGVIRLYADSGHTVLVVEHNMALIRRSCDRVVVLASGKVIAEGPPEDVVRDEQVIEAYLGS